MPDDEITAAMCPSIKEWHNAEMGSAGENSAATKQAAPLAGDANMANSKQQQQKKKERERRVAQKKLAAAAKSRDQEQTAKEPRSVTERGKLRKETVAKPDYVPTNKKSPFTQRRGGGG
jgi:hypothetical protein